jgi:RES domain
MTPTPPRTVLRVRGTHRLIASRYPSAGILDEISSPEELDHVIDLESWTNDRIQAELGQLPLVPRDEWVTGVRNASVVMAAFCHVPPGGGRFTAPPLGGWYAAFTLATAHRESIHRRTLELLEVGTLDLRVQVREYLADFAATFHDVRRRRRFAALYDPESYAVSQPFGGGLRDAGSNGIVYRSVRDPGGQCLVAFRPRLVRNVRQGAHFEYVWRGRREPEVRRLGG